MVAGCPILFYHEGNPGTRKSTVKENTAVHICYAVADSRNHKSYASFGIPAAQGSGSDTKGLGGHSALDEFQPVELAGLATKLETKRAMAGVWLLVQHWRTGVWLQK